MDPISLLTIFVLAVFVGFEVVSKVSSTLHTPLMSGANAIHGIILVGAIIVAGQAEDVLVLVIALIAVLLATVNLVGGFVVTDRMLQMFAGRKTPAPAGRDEGRRQVNLLSVRMGRDPLPGRRRLLHPRAEGPQLAQDGRRGNLIGAFGALVALVTVFLSMQIDNLPWILADHRRRLGDRRTGLAPRADDADAPAGRAVQRRRRRRGGAGRVPRAVAFRVAVVGARDRVHGARRLGVVRRFVHHLREAARADDRPDRSPSRVSRSSWCSCVLGALVAGACARRSPGQVVRSLVLLGLGLVAGALLVLPVGGADVPIVISLLNAFTGLTVAASGLVLGNVLLLVAGTLVGASGTILTRAMASAMGRSVARHHLRRVQGRLDGGFHRAVRPPGALRVGRRRRDPARVRPEGHRRPRLRSRRRAGAAHHGRARDRRSRRRASRSSFAIHPVAGRMPGHMNVLLAEANVPYESMHEMDEINPEFKNCDVALVVGANDVVNPAAKTTPGSPIYGMPILDAEAAKQVVFLKRSMRPGFAGIENELLFEPQTTLLFGDAKDTLTKVLSAVKAL